MFVRFIHHIIHHDPFEAAAVTGGVNGTAFVFGRYGLGIALCIFGISFAGFAVGLTI
jgi:hypothetical protein